MTARPLLHRIFFPRLLFAVLLAMPAAQAMAQIDPPARVARLNLNEGSVAFSPAGDTEWTDAVLNRPLTQGDRLWTDRGSRAELHAGATALRMNGQTHLGIVTLDDHATQLLLSHGAVQARLRELADGDSFQLDTPNLSFRAVQAGEYRVDVDPERGITRVTVHSGTAMAYGEGGQSLAMGGGQQVEFRGRALVQVAAQEAPPTDVFDRWAAERDRREDQSVSARYLPREVTGYQQLDAWGKWVKDPALGAVWLPRDVDATWIPFRYGRWDLVAPWGWTWIDEAPWGFATSHYGRWTQLGSRWAWVPGRMAARPVYSPALVGFFGNGAVGDSSNVQLAIGRPGVAWFPLAPGEAWKPGYKASPVYVGNVNRNMTAGEPAGGGYAHRRAEAITAIALDDFQQGRAVRGKAQRLALGELARAQVVAMPTAPGRALPLPPRLEVARAIAPQKPPGLAAVPAAAASTTSQPQAKAQVLAVAPPQTTAPAQLPAPPRQITITREQVQQALQAERGIREQAQQAELAQREQAQQAQAQALAKSQARAKAQAQAKAQVIKTQREALAKRKRQLQQEQAARQAQSLKLARLHKEQAQREQARREAVTADKAQQQARHEAQVRRVLGLANAEAQARRDAQERRELQERREQLARRDEQDRDRQQRDAQEKLQAQREALQREQQLLVEQRRRDQLERRLQQEAQQRQPAPFIVAPPQGIPVNRGSRS